MTFSAQIRVMLLLVATTLAVTRVADAATAATASSNARIEVGFGVGKNADLEFGYIVPSTTAGTVLIAAASGATRSPSGGVQLVNGALVGPAQFTVSKTGGGSKRFDVTLPAGAVTLNRAGGGATMTVDAWSQNALTSAPWSSADPFTLYIGGTLHVGASQMTGTYTGVFTITVNQH